MATPAQLVIRSRNKEIVRFWNRARFRRLAAMLELTEGELGEMAYCTPAYLRKYIKENKFHAAVAGHLENIERYTLESRLGCKFEKGTGQDIMFRKIKEGQTCD